MYWHSDMCSSDGTYCWWPLFYCMEFCNGLMNKGHLWVHFFNPLQICMYHQSWAAREPLPTSLLLVIIRKAERQRSMQISIAVSCTTQVFLLLLPAFSGLLHSQTFCLYILKFSKAYYVHCHFVQKLCAWLHLLPYSFQQLCFKYIW